MSMNDNKSVVETDFNAIKKMTPHNHFIGQSICSGYQTKYAIACNSSHPRIVRCFAITELVCQPISILSVVSAIVLAILKRMDVYTPPQFVSSWVIPILVAAAVGYLTNWIAITMLFEPYERTWGHWLPWLTFGIWRQGLVPKNKVRISTVLAEQVATKLIRPEKLADDLCEMVSSALQDPDVLRATQTLLQEQVVAHDVEIVEFFVPRIESALVSEIDRLVTSDRIKSFWDAEIMPRLESEDAREEIAKFVLKTVRERTPDIAAKVKPAISAVIRRAIKAKVSFPLLDSALASAADGIADFFLSEETIEGLILDWIRNPETSATVRDELAGFVASFRTWLASPEGASRVVGFANDIRARFKAYLSAYLHENLAPAASRLLKSDATWGWVAEAIPAVRPSVERMIRDIGTKAIIEKLDVKGRVKSAVDDMDMAEFHEMLNQVMAEHLGAIQVLGYLLGALAGLLLAFS